LSFSRRFIGTLITEEFSHPIVSVASYDVPYSITSFRLGVDPGFLAVSPQMTLVINIVI